MCLFSVLACLKYRHQSVSPLDSKVNEFTVLLAIISGWLYSAKSSLNSYFHLTPICLHPGYSVTVYNYDDDSLQFDSRWTTLHCWIRLLALNLNLHPNCVCVLISSFRRVWLCDGRAADSGGVCSQSCCQDYEEWVDSESVSKSPQWIPSSLVTQAIL